jgi:hypothetical protein
MTVPQFDPQQLLDPAVYSWPVDEVRLIETHISWVYLAGERVPAGTYREVESGREIQLDTEDYLPATLDGRVAAYVNLLYTWDRMQNAETFATGLLELTTEAPHPQTKQSASQQGHRQG